MSDSNTWHGTILSPTPEAPAPDSKQGTAQAPDAVTDTGTVGAPEPPNRKHRAQGTILPPTLASACAAAVAPVPKREAEGTGTPVAPVPKRNHNRNAVSTRQGGQPLSTQERQQIIAMAADGVSQWRIAKAVGRSRNMVKNVLAEPETQLAVTDEKAELSELYRTKAHDCVVGITDEKIAKSSALQLATASAICLDKSLLLRGQPTSIHVTALVSVLDSLRMRDDEEIERQHQQAKALLTLPANQT
jgi:hypothetical protein